MRSPALCLLAFGCKDKPDDDDSAGDDDTTAADDDTSGDDDTSVTCWMVMGSLPFHRYDSLQGWIRLALFHHAVEDDKGHGHEDDRHRLFQEVVGTHPEFSHQQVQGGQAVGGYLNQQFHAPLHRVQVFLKRKKR